MIYYISEKKSENSETILNEEMEKSVPIYVLLTYTGTTMSKVIKKFTQQPYSHASISFDSTLRKMYSFGREDVTSVPSFAMEDIKSGLFKKHENETKYSIYVTFVTESEYEKMLFKVDDFIKSVKKFKYNVKGLIANLLNLEYENDFAFFCSEFVAEVLKAGNANLTNGKHRSQIKPYDFAKNAQFKFVSKGFIKNYDSRKTEKIVNDILKIQYS